MFNKYGIEHCRIFWVKHYPCGSKKELEAEEGRIQQEIECVNKYQAGRSGEHSAKTKKNMYKNIKNSMPSTTQRKDS